MNAFNPERTAFGRHETFHLRFGWLSKGYQAWCENPNVFEQDDSTVVLGVGKNMVNAIRYWLLAAGVVKSEGRALVPTALGKALFADGGWDPYIEDDTTLWLLHWSIASNAELATSTFWFFNRFHKPEFTTAELVESLLQFCRERVEAKVAQATIKHDVALLLRMYEGSEESRSTPLEDTLDSPMSTLGLISPQEIGRQHQSAPSFRWRLPLGAFAYAVAELFDQTMLPALAVERFSRSDGLLAAPGSVFRLTEECTISKLEELVAWLPDHFELREAAGIHQFYQLHRLSPLEALRRYYESPPTMKAAA